MFRPGARILGFLAFWFFVFWCFAVSGGLAWSCALACGFLAFWLFGFLAFWLFPVLGNADRWLVGVLLLFGILSFLGIVLARERWPLALVFWLSAFLVFLTVCCVWGFCVVVCAGLWLLAFWLLVFEWKLLKRPCARSRAAKNGHGASARSTFSKE